MAQVTGMTAAEILENLGAAVVSGRIDSVSGHLLLTTRDGGVIDAGAVEAASEVHWVNILNKPTSFTPSTHTHIQDVPAATWVINHNLGRNPQVTIVDSAGSVVYGNVSYTNLNTVTATFGGAFGGRAYLT